MRERFVWKDLTWDFAFWILAATTLAWLCVAGTVAFGQTTPPLSDASDPMALIAAVLAGIQGGQWFLALPPAVYLLVWALRHWGPQIAAKLPPGTAVARVADFLLLGTLGGFVLHAAAQIIGALILKLATGAPGGWAAVFAAVSLALNELLQKWHSDATPEPVSIRSSAPMPPPGSVVNR